MLSTLEELFTFGIKPHDGKSSRFTGLKIEKLWQDEGSYHIMRLSFLEINGDSSSAAQFEDNFGNTLSAQACRLGIHTDKASRPAEKFKQILDVLDDNSLVLLIDEYDAPLTAFFNQEGNRDFAVVAALLRSFYALVKENSRKFRCVFITGITRLKDSELFTAGNALIDISQSDCFGAVCGYTRTEIKSAFADNLRFSAALRFKCSQTEVTDSQLETLLDLMAAYYDGYCFDGKGRTQVFSPWSVMLFFADEDATLKRYWAAEIRAYPTLLCKKLASANLQHLLPQFTGDSFQVSVEQFERPSDFESMQPAVLLFQTGYLTLKNAYQLEGDPLLGAPNVETKLELARLLAANIFPDKELHFSNTFTQHTLKVLQSLDADRICTLFNYLLNSIPAPHFPVKEESMVRSLITFNLLGAGIDARDEPQNAQGVPDTIINLPEAQLSLVFKYKFESSADVHKLDQRLTEACLKFRKKKKKLRPYSTHTGQDCPLCLRVLCSKT